MVVKQEVKSIGARDLEGEDWRCTVPGAGAAVIRHYLASCNLKAKRLRVSPGQVKSHCDLTCGETVPGVGTPSKQSHCVSVCALENVWYIPLNTSARIIAHLYILQ